jgi:hypothetical protein
MPLTAKILFLPPWLVLLLINTIFVGGSLILILLFRHCIAYQTRKDHHGLVSTMFGRVAPMFGILLAFIVIILWQKYQSAELNAINEANAALDVYRDLLHYPNRSQVVAVNASYEKFIKSVVQDEYPQMMQMKKSKKTQKAKDVLWLNIMKIQAKTQQEQAFHKNMLRNLELLTNFRQTRLKEMHSSMPEVLWVVIFIGAIVTILLAALLHAEKFWMHALSISMLAIVIATTIFLAIQLDYPFLGELSVGKAGYVEILNNINGSSVNNRTDKVIQTKGSSQ